MAGAHRVLCNHGNEAYISKLLEKGKLNEAPRVIDGVNSAAWNHYLQMDASDTIKDQPPPYTLGIFDGDLPVPGELMTISRGVLDRVSAESSIEASSRGKQYFLHSGTGHNSQHISMDLKSTPTTDPFWRRLTFMGRGRLAKLLAAEAAQALQSERCTASMEHFNRVSPQPLAEDYDRLAVGLAAQVRLTGRRALRPSRPEMWDTLVRDTTNDPIILASKTNESRRGRVVVALIDTELEAKLHAMRNTTETWHDFSAPYTNDVASDQPKALDSCVHLYFDGTGWAFERLMTLPSSPVLAVPEKEGTSNAAVQVEPVVKIYEDSGLRNRVATSVRVRGEKRGLGWHVAIGELINEIDQQAHELLNPKSNRTLLIEFTVQDGDHSLSLFAPLSSDVLVAAAHPVPLGPAPYLALVDTLVGLFARPKVQVELTNNEEFIRIYNPGGIIANDMQVRISLDDKTFAPIGNAYRNTLPGQHLFRVRRNWRGKEVSVHLQSSSAEETYRVFVPLARHAIDCACRPSEVATPFPDPSEAVVDTIVATTSLWDDANLNDMRESTSPQSRRGVLVIPIRCQTVDEMQQFLEEAVRFRYEKSSPSNWYMVALLTFLGVMIMCRPMRKRS